MRFMVKDDQENVRQQPGRGHWTARKKQFQAAALGLAIVGLSATGFVLKQLQPAGPVSSDPAARPVASRAPNRLFRDWPRDRKPAVVLLLSGQEYGYIQPCGCSRPQLGGLERRYNFLQKVTTENGWPVVPVDLGDLAQANGPQTLLKYKYSMECLNVMNYSAVGAGQNEMALPLLRALAEYSLNSPSPRVLFANLADPESKFLSIPGASQVTAVKDGPKVGVIGVVGPSVARQVRDPDVKFASVKKILPAAITGARNAGAELLVLLYQGSVEEAKACARFFHDFQSILCLTEEEEPPGKPDMVDDTMIVNVGHKGRYVGLVGAYRTANAARPWALYYQLAEMGEEYETPEGKDADNPVLAKLEEYTKEVHRGNYLARYGQTLHPLQLAFPKATYVGSEKCKECHPDAYKVWKNTPHSHAYDTLVKAKRPSLRQFDGECVRCHVTGFGYQGGFTDEVKTPLLKDNGCENCHGPGSLHVQGNRSPKMFALMNPCKTVDGETPLEKAKRIRLLDESCMKCHDTDNDVHWDLNKNWPKIIHMTPKD
jgi:hypothetical protein